MEYFSKFYAQELPKSWREPDDGCLFIYAIGYESRSSYITTKVLNHIKARSCIAIGFDHGHELQYHHNLELAKKQKHEFIELADEEFMQNITKVLIDKAPTHIICDISSFSRKRIACIIEAFARYSKIKNITNPIMDIVYSLAKFTSPNTQDGPITSSGPVTPLLAGSYSDINKPINCVVSLGYEQHKASGIIEYLEAADSYAFVPIGNDPLFLEEVKKANQVLLSELSQDNVYEYSVNDPRNSYLSLFDLTKGLQNHSRPILIPFGPKLMTAFSAVTVINLYPNAALWRVSSDKGESPVDRVASGNIYGLRYIGFNS